MSEIMSFPETFKEFIDEYNFNDLKPETTRFY